MNRIFTIFLLSLLMQSFAYGVEKERNGGPYLGGGYGLSSYNDAGYFTQKESQQKSAYDIFAGAYINKYLSVELNYMKSGDFNVVDAQSTHFNYSAVTVNALAHYPIWYDSIDLFAKFGAGQSFSTLASSDGSAMVFGGGVSYRIDDTFSLRAAYDIYKFNYASDSKGGYNMDLRFANVGVEVQF
jgi:hypothetical protein